MAMNPHSLISENGLYGIFFPKCTLYNVYTVPQQFTHRICVITLGTIIRIIVLQINRG